MNKYEELLLSEPSNKKRNWAIAGLIFALILISIPFVQYDSLNQKGLEIARNIVGYFFTPEFSKIFNFTGKGIPYLLLETICIALLGTLIGAAISFPLAFLASRNITGEKVSSLFVAIITVIRTIPPFVYVIIFVQVAVGARAGILAFALTSVGMISKLFIETIEDIKPGILEALDSSGANTLQKIRYGIMPQLLSNFLSTILYRFEINVKNATILGMVGAGGIGAELLFAMSNFRWQDAANYIIGIIILVLFIEFASGKLRDKLING